MENKFTTNHTNFIKGVAVCLLLWHHLFYNANFSESFNTHNMSEIISYYAKVCVAIFVILSGYGLSESYDKNNYSLKNFYIKHFKKLYLNYWLMWILFVPVGVIFFNRTLSVAYENNILIRLFLNIIGVQKVFSFYGYNATWWFMSLIIGLYLAFPLFKVLMKKYPVISLVIGFIIMFIPGYTIGIFDPIGVYSVWIFPFIFGIFCSQKDIFVFVKSYKEDNKYIKIIAYLALLISIIIFRKYGFKLTNERIDTFFGLTIILICFEYIYNIKYLKEIMIFLGKHSFNIFLFHTFIYEYYFKSFIYSFTNPIVIYIVLLAICVIISVIIEKIKLLGTRQQKQINNRISSKTT